MGLDMIRVLALSVLLLLVADTVEPPPNWLKSTVTPEIVSALLSPPAVLFQVAVTVSPTLKAPPVPVAPLMLILGSVTVGAMLSTVALVRSEERRVGKEWTVRRTKTFRQELSIASATRV